MSSQPSAHIFSVKKSNMDQFEENPSLFLPEINLKKSISQPSQSLKMQSLEQEIMVRKLRKNNPRYFDTKLDLMETEEYGAARGIISEGSNQSPSITEKENTLSSNDPSSEKKKKRLNPAAKKFEGVSNFNYMNNASIPIGESLSVSSSNRKQSFNDDSNQHYKFNISKNKQSEYESQKFKREEIFAECLSNLQTWAKDKYDNFIIQKILEIGEEKHKIVLFGHLKPILWELSKDKYGCRIFQKCLEAFPNKKEDNYEFMFSLIRKKVGEMIIHENANFVIQRCFEVYVGEALNFLLDIIKKDLKSLCVKKYGCIVINKLIDLYPEKRKSDPENGKTIEEIIEKILDDGYKLSTTEFSNYIIQHILEKGTEAHKLKILEEVVRKNFVALSSNQYASNVTEKAIIYSSAPYRTEIWQMITQKDASNKPADFLKLVNSGFGNYVMQRLYEYSDIKYRREFLSLLETYKNDLNDPNHKESFQKRPSSKESIDKVYSQFVINFTHKHSNL